MGIREVINSRDGHAYYVVETGDKKVFMGVFFLEHYEDLQEVIGEPGLWFVRDAAPDETGQHGDPTVHEGWAMYTWDNLKKTVYGDGTVKWGGWRKVAEQESVDGPWGIDERLLKMFVKRTEFVQAIDALDERIVVVEDRSSKNEQNINNLIETVEFLKKLAHKHDNMKLLDALENVGGQIQHEGSPVSTCYVYDNVQDGKLIWKDPTTESSAEEVASSKEIAAKFAETSIAFAGMQLEVVEVDGSFTRFAFVKTGSYGLARSLKYVSQIKSDRKYYDYSAEEEGAEPTTKEITAAQAKELLESGAEGHTLTYCEKKVAAVPYAATASNSRGGIVFVDTLPEAGVRNDGRGIWYPFMDDGINVPQKFYISINGVWKDITTVGGSGSEVAIYGADFTVVYSDDDPLMPFKKNHLFWNEPSDDPVNKAWWGKTTLVRKYGSEPTSVTDGDVVVVATDRSLGAAGYVDTCAYTTEPIYYRLFSETRGGAAYFVKDSVNPGNLTWANIFALMNKGCVSSAVHIGDTLVLPKHPAFGMIECEVLAVSETVGSLKGSITVATKVALDKLAFGETSAYNGSNLKNWLMTYFTRYSQLVETSVGKAQKDSSIEHPYYFYFNNGFTVLEISKDAAFPEGVTVYEPSTEFPNGLFASFDIPHPEQTPAYAKISKEKHVYNQKASIDWWTRSSLGDFVITGNNMLGVSPTTELGAVVVFTIQEV